MHFKQNRLFKSRRFQYDYKNKWIKKIQNISINDGKMFITINVGASVNIKKHCVCKNIYNWNPATYSCKNGK